MRAYFIAAVTSLVCSSALAQMPVIDHANLDVAHRTEKTTGEILDTDREVLSTVEKTLKALTGDRTGIADPLQQLAIGQGFSVSQLPAFDKIFSGGVADLGQIDGKISQSATAFLNGLKLLQNLSGRKDSAFASDKSYEEMVKTVLGVAALVNGSQQAVERRRSALEDAGATIGGAKDVKGSLDQNTQLQLQSGLTINELIGVMNGAVASLQADNQRRLTDMSNSKKALTFNRGGKP